MSTPRAEKLYEKHAWILLFALGIATLIFTVQSIGGHAIWIGLVRSAEVFSVPIEFSAAVAGWGLFLTAVARVSYRRGERGRGTPPGIFVLPSRCSPSMI